MRFIRTFPHEDEGGGVRVHLDGESDSSTLCGDDYAGDDLVHRKPPVVFEAKHARLTCPHCLAIVATVRAYLKLETQPKRRNP